MLKKAIAYIRVSSDSQEDNTSLEAQKASIAAYAAQHNYEIICTFRDVASGAKENREGLNELRKAIKAIKFDAVIVSKIDRFTRDIELGEKVRKEIEAAKGELISTHEAFDTKNYMGLAFMQMAQVFAALERNQINHRLQAGKTATVAKKGTWLGGTPPIGYSTEGSRQKSAGGILLINEEEAKIVKRCFQDRENGLSLAEIADNLNKEGFTTRKGKMFDKTTIFRILKRKEVYNKDKTINISYTPECTPAQPKIL